MKKFASFVMVSVIALWSLSSPQWTPKSTASGLRSLVAEYDFETCSVPPPTEWNKTYGGAENEFASAVVQSDDGGYALAGVAEGGWMLIKTDASGNMQWNKTYGGTWGHDPYDVVQTSDGDTIRTMLFRQVMEDTHWQVNI